jgi:DNA-directed RNA polymerase subunit M/transcription elongation factor TFIIS
MVKRLCPNCNSELEKANGIEGNKPSVDWYCPKCFNREEWQSIEYTFYDSEVKSAIPPEDKSSGILAPIL